MANIAAAVGSPVPVLYDHREERSGIPGRLRAAGVALEPQQLAVGDYVISDRLAVERKSLTDLASSIKDGRLFDQLRRLRDAYPQAVLLIEAAGDSGMSSASRRGALAWALRHGVSVMPVRDTAAGAEWIAALARQGSAGPTQPRGHGRKPKDPDRLAEVVVAGAPGVSITLARELLRHFGSIAALAAAAPGDFKRVRGIGDKRAVALAGLFHHRYRDRAVR